MKTYSDKRKSRRHGRVFTLESPEILNQASKQPKTTAQGREAVQIQQINNNTKGSL